MIDRKDAHEWGGSIFDPEHLVAERAHASEGLLGWRPSPESLAHDVALQRLETSLKVLSEQLPGALLIYRLHRDGVESLNYASQGCQDIWEVDEATARQNPRILWDMVHPADLPAMRSSVFRSAETMKTWKHEWRLTTPSGTEKVLSARGMPRATPDHGVEWCVLVLDITERKQAEEERRRLESQLRQASKMESIGRLAGGIAHDFNNVLTAIRSCAELLRTAPLDEEGHAITDDIVEGCDRAAGLTRQLLTFARSKQPDVKTLDLAAQTRRSASFLARLVGDRVKVDLRCTEAELPVRVDPTEIDQILTNLGANAREAMESRGHLRVVCRRSQDARWAVLEVSDDGPGIPPELIEHLFEPFFSTKDATRSSGLGLATVYGIVSRRGGAVEVRSSLGAGATFTVRLPLHGPAVPRSELNVLPLQAHGHGVVVVVDDDTPVRLAVTRMVRLAGRAVRQFSSAEAVLAWMQDGGVEVDVVLADISMPRMSGYALRERLLEAHPAVRVVLMSGFASEGTANTLQKPFSLTELQTALG